MGDKADRARTRPALISRRTALAAVPALLVARAAPAASPSFPGDCALLAAGPADGVLARWATRLAEALPAETPGSSPIATTLSGGEDGVTGANQFAARVAPDGLTALLVPGAAALARLTGDPRAQFDPGTWLAVLSGTAPGVCVSRLDLAATRPGSPVRVAASGPAGAELPLLLAVELLGARVEPVFGLGQREAAARALISGAVDAILVHGPGGSADVATLAGHNAQARFALGLPAEAGWQREPSLAPLPALPELLAGRDAALLPAWKAAATAAQMEFGLMLQGLSPATLVAQWRRAGEAAAGALADAVADVRLLRPTEATMLIPALAPPPAAIMALRQWLVARFKWQPE